MTAKDLTGQYVLAIFLFLAAGACIAFAIAALLRPSGPPVTQVCVKEEVVDGKPVCVQWLVRENEP